MGNGKKKESIAVKPSVEATILVSTLKSKPSEAQKEIKASEAQIPDSPGKREKQTTSGGEVGSPAGTNNRALGRPPQFTGKETQRKWEWVRFKTPIKIKLLNGEIFEGYLKWYDQFAVKLVTTTDEIFIPKHSILYILDGPKPKPQP